MTFKRTQFCDTRTGIASTLVACSRCNIGLVWPAARGGIALLDEWQRQHVCVDLSLPVTERSAKPGAVLPRLSWCARAVDAASSVLSCALLTVYTIAYLAVGDEPQEGEW